MSSLVTPGRSVARTSAWVEKGEVSTSYVHNSGSDESHAACTEHRACWRAPVHGVLCRACSGAPWLQWGPMLQPPWWGRRGCLAFGHALVLRQLGVRNGKQKCFLGPGGQEKCASIPIPF